jgi:hypothetical protein
MTDTETAYLRTVYDAVVWLAEELRQRDPNLPLPHYVSEIVFAAKEAKENERRSGSRLRQRALGVAAGLIRAVPGPSSTPT